VGAALTLDWEKDPNIITQTTCIQPVANLPDWWAGDGDGSNEQLGPKLELSKGVTFDPGMVAEAFKFESLPNAKPAYAENESIDDRLVSLQTLSIETWVYLDATSPGEVDEKRMRLQEKARNSIERFVSLEEKAVLRKEGDGRLHFYMTIDGEQRHIWSEKVLPRGEYIHAAGTYDGKWMILYWNGEKVGALEVSGLVANEGNLMLSSIDEPLFGMLDEVSIYSRALSQEEIKAIYTAGPFGKCKK
jgi:hypothetical protein